MAKLQIKDGNGDSQELYVHSGSDGLVPYHVISGSVATAMQSSDLSSLTSSISAVSSAIGLFNSQLYSALTGGPVSMSVDIVAGDVNAITSSVDKTTAEIAKLTALSGSDGLKVYTLSTASVNLVNTSSLTASVAVSNEFINVSASLTRGDSANNGLHVIPSGTVSITNPQYIRANNIQSQTGSAAESQAAWGQTVGGLYPPETPDAIKSVIISNQLNNSLYLQLGTTAVNPTTSSYTYCIDSYSTYECLPANLDLYHRVVAHPSASSGIATMTVTFKS